MNRSRLHAVVLRLLPAALWVLAGVAVSEASDEGRGEVYGRVLDASTKQALGYGNVLVQHSGADSAQVAGQVTDGDGQFRIEIPPGSYRLIFTYLGYDKKTVEPVKIGDGGSVELNARLTPRDIAIKPVDVHSTVLRAEEAAVLAKQQKSASIGDAISAEQISKTTDSNAAEAVQRVSGTTVVDGRYVFVRGLGDRYSATEVNGARVGSPEPNKRALPLDLFPANLLDNITIQKSYTPDRDGEFSGGVVQINTRDFVEGMSLNQSASAGYSAGSSSADMLTYSGGRYDFLGFDDGTRAIPGSIGRLAGNKRVALATLGRPGLSAAQLQEMGRSFSDTWTPKHGTSRPNYSYAGTLARGLHLFGGEIGFLQSLTLSNGVTSAKKQDNAFLGSGDDLTMRYRYKVNETTARSQWGSVSNLSLRLDNANTIKVRGLYTRNAEDRRVISEGPNDDYSTDNVRLTRLDYIERGLLSGVASGRHEIAPLHRSIIEWSYGYSQAERNEPDRRETRYELDPSTGKLLLSNRTQFPVSRIFGAMDEIERSADASLAVPFSAWKGLDSKMKFGYAYRNKDRQSGFRRFGFGLGVQGARELDRSLSPEQLLSDANIRPGYFELIEVTRENDSYGATHDLRAGYGMLEMPLTSTLRLAGGARYEDSKQGVDAESPFVTTVKPVIVTLHDTDVLPSAGITWAFRPNANLRANYSRTLSRPELREMSPFDMFDYETGYSDVGNVDLHTASFTNYDLRCELFPGIRNLAAASVFYKEMNDPIVRVVEPTSGGYSLKPINAETGTLYGLELEGRFGVAEFWRALDRVLPLSQGPGWLEHWRLAANYSRVKTEVTAHVAKDEQGRPVSWKGPLIGQAPTAVNVSLQYESGGFSGAIAYAAFGRRLAQVGGGQYPSSLPDIYEYPMKSLDLVLGRELTSHLKLKLSGENLLDEDVVFKQAGRVTRSVQPGRTFAFSVGYGE